MLMERSVIKPLEAMRAGFEDVFTKHELDFLTAEDMAVILNGSPEVATAGVKSHTRISGDHEGAFAPLFWEYFEGLSSLKRGELLYFWTGSYCVPSDLDKW